MIPRSFDVVVVGGGLAGAVAAKKAAEQGKTVALVRAGGGSSVHASGAFDICGSATAAPGAGAGAPPLRDALRALVRANPHHPYSLLSGGDVAAVASLLAEAVKDLFRDLDEEGLHYRGSLAKSLWLATPSGHVKESAFAQDAIAAGDLGVLSKARLALVSVGEGASESAGLQARELRRALDARGFFGLKEIAPCAVDALPGGAGRAPDALTIARALDEPSSAKAWAKEVRAALVEKAPKATHAIFPAILGLREPGAVVATLAREIGCEVAEMVALPPSLPGARLEAAIERALARKGVASIRGRAAEAEAAEQSIRALRVEAADGPLRLELRALVLAGGKFLGGGLRDGNRILEPLLDLPLFHRGRPFDELAHHEWTERHVAGDHAVFSMGLRCGADLRPIGRSGGPAFENLFAAGSILEGVAFPADRAGLGVALATGFVAGLNASGAI